MTETFLATVMGVFVGLILFMLVLWMSVSLYMRIKKRRPGRSRSRKPPPVVQPQATGPEPQRPPLPEENTGKLPVHSTTGINEGAAGEAEGKPKKKETGPLDEKPVRPGTGLGGDDDD